MTDKTSGATWPQPTFYFKVSIPGLGDDLPFQEVSGLDSEAQVIEYRRGDSKPFSPIKRPALTKYGNVTLKRGVVPHNDTFGNWYSRIMMNTVQRATVIVALCSETGDRTMSWQLTNAWPTKITGTDLKSDGNEVAIETLEIAYEVLTITNA